MLCPYCNEPVTHLEGTPPGEVHCPRCGSDFSPTEGSTLEASTLGHDPTERAHRPSAVLGKFELLQDVGAGAFGTVYRARDTELDRIVAVKVPKRGQFDSDSDLDRFLREARSAAQLTHPGIVAVHEVGSHEGLPYLVSDFVEGRTLDSMLRTGRLPIPRCVELLIAIGEAIEYAHGRGVVHRDLKPSNIMIGPDGAPRVMDFGLAKREVGETLTVEGQVLGTPAYMSPEQARGEGYKVDGRSDVYSLGVILYRMLTGELPFRGNVRMLLHQVLHEEPRAPRSLDDSIPRDLDTIVNKAMAKEPARRYSSAGELVEDLGRFTRGEPILARPAGVWERAWRWAKRRPALAGLIVACVVALSALTAATVGYVYNEALQRSFDSETQARKNEARQRARAESALGIARRAEYANQILLADRAFRENDRSRCQVLLDGCNRARRGWEWYHLRNTLHGNLFSIPEAEGPATFGPNGRWLAARVDDRFLGLWDLSTKKLAKQFRFSVIAVDAFRFSPSGRWLAGSGTKARSSGSPRVVLEVWDTESGEKKFSRIVRSLSARTLAFSPDETLIAVGTGKSVQLFDVAEGELVRSFEDSRYQITDLCFSLDGSRLVTCNYEPNVRVRDVRSGRDLLTLKSSTGSVQVAAYSPDGRWIATGGGASPLVEVWDATTGERAQTCLGLSVPVASLRFSPDGTHLAAGGGEYRTNQVCLWEIPGGLEKLSLRAHPGRILRVEFDPEGHRLLVGTTDGAWVWDARRGQGEMRLESPVFPADIAFDSQGKRFAVACAEVPVDDSSPPRGAIEIRELQSGRVLVEIGKLDYGVERVRFSPDGSYLATIEKGIATIRNSETGRVERTLEGRSTKIEGVCFSPDGSELATAGGKSLAVWNARTGELLLRLQGEKKIADVLYTPSGHLIVFTRAGIEVRSRSSGKRIRTFGVSSSAIRNFALSPDGRRLAVTYRNNVQLWDVTTGKKLVEGEGHTMPVAGVRFSPDGTRLVSVSADRTLKVWNAGNAREILSVALPLVTATRVAFQPKGDYIGSICGRTILLWNGCRDLERARSERLDHSEQTKLDWHREEAELGESGRNWFSAAFHLDWLLRSNPESASLAFRLGRAFSRLGETARARQAFSKALQRADELAPRDILECHAEMGQWDKAASLATRSIASEDASIELWIDHALLCLRARDIDGYRRACDSIWSRFGRTRSTPEVHRLVWLKLLSPRPKELPRLLDLAEQIVRANGKRAAYRISLASAHFRAGQFDKADQQLENVTQSLDAKDVAASFWLAMVQQRRNGPAKAQATFDEAVDWLERSSKPRPGEACPNWRERVVFEHLRHEATSVLKSSD